MILMKIKDYVYFKLINQSDKLAFLRTYVFTANLLFIWRINTGDFSRVRYGYNISVTLFIKFIQISQKIKFL